MRIPGLKKVKRSARWLRSRLVDGALILGYHRIAAVSNDPFGMCIAPQHFAEQLEILSRFTRPISLPALMTGLQTNSLPERAVILTFDDGYADILYQAKPLLERFQIPATIFVVTGFMGRQFWWDQLERYLLSSVTLPNKLSLSINGDIFEWTLEDATDHKLNNSEANPRRLLLTSLYQRLLPLPSDERQKVMGNLRLWAGEKEAPNGNQACRVMTPAELIELNAAELVSIGAHTVTHPVLSKLPIMVQRSEIQQSKVYLEELLRQPVTYFSYPNGSSSTETRRIVQEAGFGAACASFNDITWAGSNYFHLPRFWVQDVDGDTFFRWLKWWLPG